LEYQSKPISGDYYDDREFNQLLAGYQERLGDTFVSLPVAGLRCCRFFRRLSGGRMLLLSADKGPIHERELIGMAPPGLVSHGSFSMGVNYHALGRYFANAGGQVMHARHPSFSVAVAGFVLGESELTRQAFAEAVEQFGPDDFFLLKKATEPHYGQLTLLQLLAFVRLSRHDPRIFEQSLPALSERAREASRVEKQELARLAQKVWEHYFHLGEESDLAFQIGLLMLALDELHAAADFFQRSLALHGADANTLFNLAVCHRYLHDDGETRRWLDATLAVDPAHPKARALRLELAAREAPAARPYLELLSGVGG
jgi:tetratricopeptide (TPR) repeat protein